ncbi:MAG: hypothetical protein ABSA23_08610 [Anaerolineales bacterium]
MTNQNNSSNINLFRISLAARPGPPLRLPTIPNEPEEKRFHHMCACGTVQAIPRKSSAGQAGTKDTKKSTRQYLQVLHVIITDF